MSLALFPPEVSREVTQPRRGRPRRTEKLTQVAACVVVAGLIDGGQTVSQVAAHYGKHESTIRRWYALGRKLRGAG